MNYYVQLSEATKGPFSLAEIAILAKSRQLKSSTLICVEGSQNWMSAAETTEIAPLLPKRPMVRKKGDGENMALNVVAAFIVVALAVFFVGKSDSDLAFHWAVCLAVWSLISGFIGANIGKWKWRAGLGFALGAVFGPLGWWIALHVSDHGPRCGNCLEGVGEKASVCRHCGRPIERG